MAFKYPGCMIFQRNSEFYMERYNLKELNVVEIKCETHLQF
jgi:hypothetical protein